MIHDIDATLSQLLLAELIQMPGCPVRDAAQITFDPPAVAETLRDGEARINLYLFQLQENVQKREYGIRRIAPADPKDMSVGTRRPPVWLNLAYLITAHAGGDAFTEHRLMSDALGALLRNDAVPPQHLVGLLAGQDLGPVQMSVAQPDDTVMGNPRDLWQSLGGNLRPAILLVVSAPFDPFDTLWKKRVREITRGMGPTTADGVAAEPSSLNVSVVGIALDQETEAPVTGAAIYARLAPADAPPLARTDEEGRFALQDQPSGPLGLRFVKQGYRTVEADTVVPLTGRLDLLDPLVIALRPLDPEERARERAALADASRNYPEGVVRASLSGTLRYPDGRIAGYVTVRIGSRRVVTDRHGIYLFSDMPPGEYTLIAELPGVGEKDYPVRVVG